MLYHEYLNDDRGGKPPTQHTKYEYFVCAVCAVVVQACDSSLSRGWPIRKPSCHGRESSATVVALLRGELADFPSPFESDNAAGQRLIPRRTPRCPPADDHSIGAVSDIHTVSTS